MTELEQIFRKGYKRRTKEEKKRIRAGLEASRSFIKREKRHRGVQPLCRSCKKRCKVLDGPDSTFACCAYEKIKRRKK